MAKKRDVFFRGPRDKSPEKPKRDVFLTPDTRARGKYTHTKTPFPPFFPSDFPGTSHLTQTIELSNVYDARHAPTAALNAEAGRGGETQGEPDRGRGTPAPPSPSTADADADAAEVAAATAAARARADADAAAAAKVFYRQEAVEFMDRCSGIETARRESFIEYYTTVMIKNPGAPVESVFFPSGRAASMAPPRRSAPRRRAPVELLAAKRRAPSRR